MQGKRKHPRILGKNRGGSVPLMDVEVDDGDLSDPEIPARDGDGDGEIVEHAEALATLAKAVVGAPGEVPRRPEAERPR